MHLYFEDLVYEKQDYARKTLPKGDYEGCRFKSCDFTSASVASINFIDCCFKDCNLSGCSIEKASFQNTVFKNSKLVGLRFEEAQTFLFTPQFENSTLTLSSFYTLKLKHSVFRNCILKEVDFTDADCSTVLFDNCDFTDAKFENTNLEKADLTSSYNYRIDPERNRIKKAKFSLMQVAGLLDKYDIVIK